MRSARFCINRKHRRERVLLKMAQLRATKARRRTERIAAGELEREPRMLKWHRFEYGIRDKVNGETHWRDLVSIRQAAKALALIVKYIS